MFMSGTRLPSPAAAALRGLQCRGARHVAALPRKGSLRVQAAQKQTFSSFDDMISRSDEPVLVDYYAAWCGPCQYMIGQLGEVSAKTQGKLRVVKIDTEKYTEIANRFQIRGLPTLILFKNGKPAWRMEGALSAADLLTAINPLLV